MITKKELGERIRKLRVEKNLSQKQLGEVLNRSHAAISDIERGKTDLNVTDLLKIAEFLNTNVSYILNIQTNSPNYIIHFQGSSIETIDSNNGVLNIADNSQNKFLVK